MLNSDRSTDPLLSPDFMARLDRLDLVSRKIFAGKMRGERLTKRRGESVEFADYRSYVVGDDLRFLDWNIYARLERLFIRLFLQEEDLHVSVLFDVSGSMDWGEPHKGLYARRIAAALAYLGLINFDRVSLYAYADGLRATLTGVRGRRMMFKTVEFLTQVDYGGISNLPRAGREFVARHPQPGIVVIIGDFLEKGGVEEGLRVLHGRRYDLYLIHVLSPDEVDPDLLGDLALTDVEDEDRAEITVSRALLQRYQLNLTNYCGRLDRWCTRRGAGYVMTRTRDPFDRAVLSYLRTRGLVH